MTSNLESIIHNLKRLGLQIDNGREPRSFALLRAILKRSSNGRTMLTFNQIYKAFLAEIPSKKFSKPWVHKLLQELIDQGFVTIENPNAYRKNYLVNVNTIMTALGELREKAIDKVEQEFKRLEEEYRALKSIDVEHTAKELVRALGGGEQQLISGSIRGAKELHRIVAATIYSKARKGDVIRASMLRMTPFGSGVYERTNRIFELVESGVVVKYLLNLKIIREDMLQIDSMRKQLDDTFAKTQEYVRHMPNFDVRFFSEEEFNFEFISLNMSFIVFVLSQSPVLGAWMIYDFNVDLINNAIRSFDEIWESAISITDIELQEVLAEKGAS